MQPPRISAPLSLYIHIPWCVRKCPYCDFNSHALREPIDQAGYVDALLADLDVELTTSEPRPLQSIFFGGGTPSLLEADLLVRLLKGVTSRMAFAEDIEITLEANPGAAEAARFAAYRAAGVNRLSIGVQSLDDVKLSALGRIHSADDARETLRMARAAGFDNVNLDLMYGLPEQSLGDALEDLRGVIELAPEHLSWYQLTLEPNTLFHHQPPVLPDEDRLADMMDRGQQILAAAGFRQYEISAYARAKRQCRHNLNYWQFGDYLGIGAGAHGKLSGRDGRVVRRSKQRQPAAYVAARGAAALSSERALDEADLSLEFFLNAMRLFDGVPARWFAERTGLDVGVIAGRLAEARDRGLMSGADQGLRPTALGLRYLNDLLALFESP